MNYPATIYTLMVVMGSIIALSNVLVQYPLGEWLTYGALTYPLVFLVTDISTRLYGKRVAGRVVTVGIITAMICTLVASYFDVSTVRIAFASVLAFFIAQAVDIRLFLALKHLDWWKTPVISSALASIVDTFIFFSIAFSATTFLWSIDANDWAFESIPLLGIGPSVPLWVSLALADLGVKLLVLPILLIPYRYFVMRFNDKTVKH